MWSRSLLALALTIGLAGSAGAADQTPLKYAPNGPNSSKVVQAMQSGDTVGVPHGGTSKSTITSHCMLVWQGASAPNVVCPSSAGQVFGDNGASSDPSFQSLSGLLDTDFGSAQGDILYRDSSTWHVLAPGTAGQCLITGGASANPSWTASCASGGGGGGGLATPGTIADLVYWVETDNLTNFSSGSAIPVLLNRVPWLADNFSQASTGVIGATIASTSLNSLPVLQFPASSNGDYANSSDFNGICNGGCTVFVVANIAAVTSPSAFTGGNSGALEFRVDTASKLSITAENVAAIATSTSTITTGSWFQANVTYNPTSGAYAFRLAQAAAGSGTSAHTVSAANNGLGYNAAGSSEFLNGKLALVIFYERVLTPTEISNVEAYIHTKWGV